MTAAAKNEAVASGSGKAISTLPTPQNGGATPTPTPTPLPYSPINPPNPAAYVHVSPALLPMFQTQALHITAWMYAHSSLLRVCLGNDTLSMSSRCALLQSLLSDKSAEVVGESFLAISPTAGVPEPDFVEMMPAQASAPAAAPLVSPVQVASLPQMSFLRECQLLRSPTIDLPGCA